MKFTVLFLTSQKFRGFFFFSLQSNYSWNHHLSLLLYQCEVFQIKSISQKSSQHEKFIINQAIFRPSDTQKYSAHLLRNVNDSH